MIDLLCLGVSSPGIFAEYVEYLNEKYRNVVKEIQFRKWELEKKDLANHVYEWEYFNDSDNPSSFINLARRKAAEQNIELYKLKK